MESNSKNQKILIIINALKIILTIFTSTFFISYIVALTPENIFGLGVFNVGVFYFSEYLVYILTYYLLSKFVAKSNRVSFLRIGILINGILLITLIFFGSHISKWIPFAGGLIGIADAFYNSSYLVMKNEQVKRKNINNYNLMQSVTTNLINVVVPIILGYLIDVTTFTHIAIYIVFIVAIQLAVSFLIQTQKPINSYFKLKQFLKFLKEDKQSKNYIKWTYINAILAGLKNTYKILIVILTIYIFKTNLSLGILTSIFSITTAILLIVYKKFEYHKKMNKLILYMFISILPIIFCLCFIIFKEKIFLILLNFTLTVAIQFSEYGSNSERDAIIKNLNKKEFILEHQFYCEFLMCVGRISSYLIFIIIGLISNINIFTALLIIFISINPIKFLVMYKQTKVRKELENK